MNDQAENLRRLYVESGANYLREAASELERNQEAIKELTDALNGFLSLDKAFTNRSITVIKSIPGPLAKAVVKARLALDKHSPQPKE